MAYVARTIKDRVAVGDDCFLMETLSDGRVKLTPSPDSVSEPGTDINKALLQLIEDRVVGLMNGIFTATATLPSTGWTGDAAPYAQEVTVTGITAADTPLVDIVQTGTEATDEPMREAWGVITRMVTGAGKITAYASEKPIVNIPIQLKVVKNNG